MGVLMKETTLFQINIFEFMLPNDLLDKLLDLHEKVEYRKNFNNQVTSEFYIEELSIYINQCCKELKEKIYPGCNADMVCTTTWLNKSTKLQFHHKHLHSCALWSGVIYLTGNKNDGETIFYMEDPWHFFHNKKFLTYDNSDEPKEIIGSVAQEKGKMIIFPSNLFHSTRPTVKNNYRYTIAFNTFFSGYLGHSEAGNRLNINTYQNKNDPVVKV